MRHYRKMEKRRAYNSYARETQWLKDRFEKGEISQEEFERSQEMLDDRFRFVR